jgi:hypothetical protein
MAKRKIARLNITVDVEAGARVALPSRADIAAGLAAHLGDLEDGTVSVTSVSGDGNLTTTERKLKVIGTYFTYGDGPAAPDLEELRNTPAAD